MLSAKELCNVIDDSANSIYVKMLFVVYSPDPFIIFDQSFLFQEFDILIPALHSYNKLYFSLLQYLLEELKTICETKLIKTISNHNVLHLLKLAKLHRAERLGKEVKKFLDRYVCNYIIN